MKLSHKIKMDLIRQGIPPRITMVQGDAYTRRLEIALYADKRPWRVPENVSVLIRYRKPDRTSGSYDTLADGTNAVSVSGNRIYILIAPEMLSIAGTVTVMITILRGEQRLSTFTVDLVVQPDCVSGWDDTESASWIAAFLPSPKDAVIGQYLTVDNVDEQGHVTSVTTNAIPGVSNEALQAAIHQQLEEMDLSGTAGADGGYYTPQIEIPSEGELLFQFTASQEDMPSITPKTVRLPEGPQGQTGEKGDKGDPGADGADGLTPFIGENGNWWLGDTDTGVTASGSGGSSATILEETTYEGFVDGILGITPAPFVLAEGETYRVAWDGVEHECVCTADDDGQLGITDLVLGENAEPTQGTFAIIYHPSDDVMEMAAFDLTSDTMMDTVNTSHTVGIYQEDAVATESFVKNYVEQYISEALGGDY